MPELNDAQFGLFSKYDPAMRERSHAEMSTEQFRTLPGAYHHATYAPRMPERSTGPDSAGIHLGTRKAAMERVDDMGARNPQMSDIHADESKPADIHVRRVSPDAPGPVRGSERNPTQDRGEDWRSHAVDPKTFGEHYRNTHEDEGSISLRVPNGEYLDSHRKAVDRATRSGAPVHPEAAAAHAGGHLDKPEQYTAGSRPDTTTEYARYQQRRATEPSASDNRDQGMLLPHKVQAIAPGVGKQETIPGTAIGGGPRRAPAVTFAASPEERDEFTSQTYKTVMGDHKPLWESKTGKF